MKIWGNYIRSIHGFIFLKKLILCIAFAICITSIHSNAQNTTVNASTNKNKILLGEPFWLILEAKSVKATSLPRFKIDSIPHFEFIIKDSAATTRTGDTLISKQYYQLTSFDSGRWVIPSFSLIPYVKTNSVLMDVVFTDGFNSNDPYHDVQEIKGVPFKMDATIERWWYPTALLFILLTLIFYWLTQEKKRVPTEKKLSSEAAYRKAMLQLKTLKESNPNQKGLYFQLVEIFRTYVLEKTGISSLQETSEGLVEKLQPLFNDEAKYQHLSRVLHLCDFVKFAKYHPDKNETDQALIVIEDSINYIETNAKLSNKVS